jgi:hypothetical protein
METLTRHLLDSLIKAMTDDIEMLETQMASCRREEPKAVLHLQDLQKKYIETREFTVHVLNDIYGL